jgi:hypothetical protein
LDDKFDPYVTVDGAVRNDLYVTGLATEFQDRATGQPEDYVWIYIGDLDSDVRLRIALFPARMGVTLAVPVTELTPDMRPRPVAWTETG